MLQNIINGVLGLVVIVVAFLGLSATTLTWTLVVLGAVIAAVGLWGSAVVTNDIARHA